MDIDCVFDDALAQEMAQYLKNKGHTITVQNSTITTKSDPIDDVVNFSVETNRQDYQINFFENTLIFSRKIPIEKIGLISCKQCGFLAQNKSDLELHQNVHMPKSQIRRK
ncbi:MAG: hypothetical protein EB150_09815 [Nitrososphaeria archaeon]|nr:hypothetical protein [Nitrososphaeria archaeon]NDB64035.1 hypothetical protein [Nitrosopumilaceae archaeon]NDB92461.1 hypothetical protein [Nitrososphaeria archaeon]NDF27463.1 hypothetical protein [Nitrosopumilaceae archaeon]NDF30471.1 hypothetical protein [Nitrososphaeria archaeon]